MSRPKIRVPFPTVLLAWDAEDPAPGALSVVKRLAEVGARVEALFVTPPSYAALSARDQRALRERWARTPAKAGVPLRFAAGGTIPRLLAWIDARKPSLVVVGSRRAGLLERLLLGSVATALKRRSSAPVLVVPARARR